MFHIVCLLLFHWRLQVILFESDFNAKGDIDTLDVITRHGVNSVKVIRLVTCSMVRSSFMHTLENSTQANLACRKSFLTSNGFSIVSLTTGLLISFGCAMFLPCRLA